MKRRPDTSTILDWEELEQAPNTHGAFSFLRPQNPVINIQEHRPRDIPQSDYELATQDKNPSQLDYMIAVRMRVTGHSQEAITKALLEAVVPSRALESRD